MTDFLLELLSEEIPARMQEKACGDLARLFGEELAKAGLKPEGLTGYVTPRRLALIARGLPLETAAVSEETKGPKVGAPPQALEGFLRKTGLTADQLVERDGTLFAIVEKPGRKTAEVLAEAIPAIIRAFPWPKSMRWGTASASTSSLRWVRPLQGIVALLGDDVVPVEIDGLKAGATTVGHRFHHPAIVTIGNAADYAAKLRACHVIVDPADRRDIIRTRAAELAGAAGLTVIPDEGLVAENAGLTEWPVPLLGHFDPAFLEVPREVIQLTLRTNQKYFVLNDAEGKLAPAFICTANIVANDGGQAIVAGNGKVLAARLSDAKFFWEQDLKVPLLEQAQKLGQIVFHEKLGTIADRVDRVRQLACWLVDVDAVKPEMDNDQPKTFLYNDTQDAAALCKADLVSGMVGEFPELQGIMGGYYAQKQGMRPEVGAAIRDHYKPLGSNDGVPSAPVTVAVALADKLDTLACFFVAGLLPTGSKDPFALRRAALGVIEIIQRNQLRFSVRRAATYSMARVSARVTSHEAKERLDDLAKARQAMGDPMSDDEFEQKRNETRDRLVSDEVITEFTQRTEIALEKLLDFFVDRLKVQQREAGVRHDLIDAVFALGGDADLVRLLTRVAALQAFVATEDGVNLLAGYKRAANILKKESVTGEAVAAYLGVDWGYQPEPAEAALKAALDEAEPKAAAAVEAEDFAGAMSALATLRAPIDAFFDKVTVNDSDGDKRNTRLALLEKIRAAVHNVADFSKIEA